jgi:hypothetical protein
MAATFVYGKIWEKRRDAERTDIERENANVRTKSVAPVSGPNLNLSGSSTSLADWLLHKGLRPYLLGLGFLLSVAVIVVAGKFVLGSAEESRGSERMMSLEACEKLIRETTTASEELITSWYFQPVKYGVISEAVGICKKRTPQYKPTPQCCSSLQSGISTASNDWDPYGDSDSLDYWDGDSYNNWDDYPEDDDYAEDPGWQPYYNGREWMNDPGDTWGDGR